MLKKIILLLMIIPVSNPVLAVDSYRFLHVTIETPWLIFLFLLVIVLSPFILSAVLYWYYAGKRPGNEQEEPDER